MNDKPKTGIRVLIITPTLQCGGSEKFVSLVCNHLNTNLFSICLVVVNNAKPFYEITNKEIEIVDLKKTRVLFSLAAIKKTVNIFKPDIIFSTANHLNLYLAIFKNQFNASINFMAREASIVSINSGQAPMPALYGWLIKKYYNRFNLVICQSDYMRQDLVNHFAIPDSKIMVIHNATPEVPEKTTGQNNKEDTGSFKFITVARLSKEKGIERLIQAVALLTIPFKYYIFGEGTERNRLQELINGLHLQDKIILAGEKSNPYTGMQDADLFLMGSFYEGFPNVLLEAGANGIPVIAFNAPGGIAEIITENENGLLVADNNITAFAAAIQKTLALNFNRGTIIETTKKRFSVNNMMTAMENIFLKLAQNK